MKLAHHADLSHYSGEKLVELDPPFLAVQAFDEAQCARYTKLALKAANTDCTVHDARLPKGATVNYDHRRTEYCHVGALVIQELQARIDFVINYHLAKVIGRKLILENKLQVLKYTSESHGHFSQHTDNAYVRDGQFVYAAPKRKLSTITYLNDGYAGGHLKLATIMNELGQVVTFKPALGSMIIFPADMRYPHEVLPVTAGTRVCVVGWYDYDRPL